MVRRALLAGMLLGGATSVAANYQLQILVGLVPPKGVDLRLHGPDGGVAWEAREATSQRLFGMEFMDGAWWQGAGRYRLVVTPPPPLRACEKSFQAGEESAYALFGVVMVDGGCEVRGKPSRGLLGRQVGDFPPYQPPFVQPGAQ